MSDHIDWEAATRQLLKQKAERVGQDVDDALAPLRRLHDPGLGVPSGTETELRVVIAELEAIADAVQEVDPAVGEPPEADHEIERTATDD